MAHCVVVYCVCLYLGAQAWIGGCSGAALPPTPAAPWTRALLLSPTGRPLVVGSQINHSSRRLIYGPRLSWVAHLRFYVLHFASWVLLLLYNIFSHDDKDLIQK